MNAASDEINFEHLIVYQKDLVKETAFGHEEQVMAAYRAAEAKAAGLGVITTFAGFARKKSEPGCPFSMFSVLTDGTVGFCGAQRALVGSVLDGGPLEIWNGRRSRACATASTTGEPLHQCKSCPNMTNAAVDFIQPDMSYVKETLGMRRLGQSSDLKTRKGGAATRAAVFGGGSRGPRCFFKPHHFARDLAPPRRSAKGTHPSANFKTPPGPQTGPITLTRFRTHKRLLY